MSLNATRWRRLRRNVPLMVTIALHAVAILVAAVWVVSETIVGGKQRFEAAPPPAKAAASGETRAAATPVVSNAMGPATRSARHPRSA